MVLDALAFVSVLGLLARFALAFAVALAFARTPKILNFLGMYLIVGSSKSATYG